MSNTDKLNKAINDVLPHIAEIGKILAEAYPPVTIDDATGFPGGQAVDDLGEIMGAMMAELAQFWLNAGSEREMWEEDLVPVFKSLINSYSEESDWMVEEDDDLDDDDND